MPPPVVRHLKTWISRSLLLLILAAQNTAVATTGNSPWGTADEIGTLNMMTESSMFDALRRVSSGKVYDLGVDYFVGMPTCCEAWGDPPFQIWMTHTPSRRHGQAGPMHSGDAFSMSLHTGTHIDTLNHFGLHGHIWNGVRAEEAMEDRGWRKSGADKYPPIIARGVLIDVAGSRNVAHLPASYPITARDLQQALERQQTSIRPGDVVLVRTGLISLWPDKAKYRLANQPGLSLEAAKWLIEERRAMMLGSDNFGVESFPAKDPATNFAPVHTYLLAERGVSILEVLWLEDLARDRVYEFVFVASPLELRGATGSPVRPIAIPLR